MNDSDVAEIDNGLSQSFDEAEESFAPIISQLQDWILQSLQGQDKTCGKCSKKINGYVNKQQTINANSLDQILTAIGQWIDQNQLINDFTLSQIGAKTGVLLPGQGLGMINWHVEPAASLGPEYGGILVLSCRELGPCLEPLVEVLREIRDRMGTLPAGIGGEPPAEAPVDAQPAFFLDDSVT